ncbi:MAG: carbohydrate ABC transporter permease [Clostridia bacterium]
MQTKHREKLNKEDKNKKKKEMQLKRAADQQPSVADVPAFVKILGYFITTLVSITTLVPLLLTISVSFTADKSLALYGYKLIPKTFSLEAYRYIISNGSQIWHSYGVTIFITVFGTAIGLICMSLFTYAVTRNTFPWGTQFVFVVFFCMLFSGGMVPTYMVVANVLHLRDTIWALILPGCMSGMYIMILKTYMRTSIPPAVIESAKMDGAGEYRCFFTIVLPMAVPVLATIALFLAINFWNGWYHAFLYIVKNQKIVPIQLLLKRFENNMEYLANSSNLNFQEAEQLHASLPVESAKMALVVMVATPILIAFPFFQRFFVKGITVGAVKG